MMNGNHNANTLVLVTGASGYIGSHCVKQLIEAGYRVRGTVRSLKNPKKVDPVKALDTTGRLQLVEADLNSDKGWDGVLVDCDFVLHVASPFPLVADERFKVRATNPGLSSVINFLVHIPRTLNVLRAANRAPSVRKVVLTSSCASISDGHPTDKVFDETFWTNLDNPEVDAYGKSKVLAEKAAWQFVEDIKEGNRFALTTLNPTLVFGPVLIREETGASISLIRRLMNFWNMPACPPFNFGFVDVRDVAKAHILAMQRTESDGQRILLSSKTYWLVELARALRKEFSSQGYRITGTQSPYWLVWLMSFVDKESDAFLPRLRKQVLFDNSKAQRLLGMQFRDPKDSVVGMAYTMIEKGLISKTSKYGSGKKIDDV